VEIELEEPEKKPEEEFKEKNPEEYKEKKA